MDMYVPTYTDVDSTMNKVMVKKNFFSGHSIFYCFSCKGMQEKAYYICSSYMTRIMPVTAISYSLQEDVDKEDTIT